MKLLLFLLAAVVAFAGWEDVQRVSPDRRVEVVMREGKRLRGTFVSASETALVLRSKSGEHSISRGDIRRVRVADTTRRVRNVLIGAVIGAGAGLAIGAAVCPQCPNEGAGAKYMGPFTAAGAGIGAAAGLLPAPYRTLYQAR